MTWIARTLVLVTLTATAGTARADALSDMVAGARTEGLPTAPLESKIKEGRAKRVPEVRIRGWSRPWSATCGSPVNGWAKGARRCGRLCSSPSPRPGWRAYPSASSRGWYGLGARPASRGGWTQWLTCTPGATGARKWWIWSNASSLPSCRCWARRWMPCAGGRVRLRLKLPAPC